MGKIVNFLKRNVVIHIGVGIWLGVMGAVYVIYSNAEVSSGLNANSVDIDTTNMPLVGENKKLDEVLDYLYEKAALVGQSGCQGEYICLERNPAYQPQNDTNTYTQSEFVQNLQVGDLIKMTPSHISLQLDGSNSGFTSANGATSQTYKNVTYYPYDDTTHPTYLYPSELQYWRVISKNTNGTIDVVSEYVSSIPVYFYGILGYANAVGYLNEIASYYENPAYTIGSRMMGYDGQTQYKTDTSAFDGSTDPSTQTFSTSFPTSGTGQEYNGGVLGDTLYLKDYQAVINAYKGTTIGGTDGTVKTYQVGTTTATSYWLASRRFSVVTTSDFRFSVCYVYTDGSLYPGTLRKYYSSIWYNYSAGYAVRPILTLKADITNTSIETGININRTTSAYVLG